MKPAATFVVNFLRKKQFDWNLDPVLQKQEIQKSGLS